MTEIIAIEKDNPAQYAQLEALMYAYVAETDRHRNAETPKHLIPRITRSMIDKLDESRLLRMALDDGEAIGFCYAKIDKEGDRGLIRPGWGYMMEFFVHPAHRRKGIGRRLTDACEAFFAGHGVHHVWLTADAVTGVPFWLSCGYSDSGADSPENGQRIFEKRLNKTICE